MKTDTRAGEEWRICTKESMAGVMSGESWEKADEARARKGREAGSRVV